MPVIKAQSSRHQLTDAELAAMEELTDFGNLIGEYLDGLAENPDIDSRWLAIARTHLQQGFMAAKRAVAKPAAF